MSIELFTDFKIVEQMSLVRVVLPVDDIRQHYQSLLFSLQMMISDRFPAVDNMHF